MGLEIIIAAAAPLVAGAVAAILDELRYFKPIQNLINRVFPKSTAETSPSFADQMEQLSNELRRSSVTIDRILTEVSSVASQRAAAIQQLEAEIRDKTQEHQELEARLHDLQGITLPAVRQLEKILNREGRASAMRDYLLFAAGVISSVVVTLILKGHD